ncbi:MAG: flagellar basal body-associated FliL family protein [Armatimonadota bacterium]|nr:flagellar basal body-associated FliL family protein [bacterium]
MKNNSGQSKTIMIVAVGVVVILAGMGFMMFKSKGSAKNAKPEKLPTAEMALGDFVVNLADTDQVRYLKTTIVLEVEGGAPAAKGGEGGEGGADVRIRDAVIQVLSSKTFAQLSEPDGKEKLKKDIITAVNERLEEGKAVEVFFNEFAMQ